MEKAKKKILLINSNFGIGGIQSSMINMVNELSKIYDVDIAAFYPEGILKSNLDSRVNIVKTVFAVRVLGMTLKEVIRSKNILIILFGLFANIWTHIFNNRLPVFLATMIQPKLEGYDLAIAFRQENQKKELASGYVRFLNRCVKAKKKLAWIHCDSTFFPESQEFNRKYYKNVDKIIGVSRSVAAAFEKMNPELSDKVDYCYNFLNFDTIMQKSEEEQMLKYPENKFICFSACRLSKGKGIERTISAIAPIMRENSDIMWYIAGDGLQRKSIKQKIEDENLKERIILLGNQSNPYPYMKNSNLFMLTSYHEAAPMVYLEAKALGTPIFTTKTLSSEEMLEDGANAFICENSDEGIREKFAELMADREKIFASKAALENYRMDNCASIRKIAELIK